QNRQLLLVQIQRIGLREQSAVEFQKLLPQRRRKRRPRIHLPPDRRQRVLQVPRLPLQALEQVRKRIVLDQLHVLSEERKQAPHQKVRHHLRRIPRPLQTLRQTRQQIRGVPSNLRRDPRRVE